MATYPMKNIVAGFLKKKIPIHEQAQVLIRIGEMLNNGFSLSEAIEFQSKLDHRREEFYDSIIRDIRSGKPLHEAFHESNFDSQACAQLFFADKHGFLADALKESGQYLLRKTLERKKLSNLMQYPLILIFVLIIISLLMQLLLLPRFTMLYGSMGYEPSVGIKLILHLSQNTFYYLSGLICGVLIILSISKSIIRRKSALEVATLYSRIPFVHSFYKLYQTVFLSREWSFLLKSGFSMNEIIQIMERQNFQPLLRETAVDIKEMLKVGYSFSEAISHLCFLENEMKTIVAHGEQNGKLDSELLYYSDLCLQTLEDKTMKMFRIIQPAIFGLIGLIVIAVYMSIFLPMFQMIESI